MLPRTLGAFLAWMVSGARAVFSFFWIFFIPFLSF